ncbi:MAG: hypothetical protein KF716_13055 [Anaerolineae bacterium]|nr:hypothetical protein [Anaerolineae bacterium]
MRTRLIVLLMSLGTLLLSGCSSASDPFASNDLCKYYRVTSGDLSGGQSSPYPITVAAGQTVSLSYVAEMEEGSAEFQLLNDLSDPKWMAPVTPTTTTATLTVDTKLDAGPHNMIIVFSKAKKYRICWKVDVK